MKNSLQQSNIIENLKRYKRAEGISGNLGLPLRRQMIITFLARIVRESSIQARLRSTSRSVKTWLTSQNQLIGIQEFHKRPLCKWTKNCRNNFLLQTLKFNKGKMNFLLHPKQANYWVLLSHNSKSGHLQIVEHVRQTKCKLRLKIFSEVQWIPYNKIMLSSLFEKVSSICSPYRGGIEYNMKI